MSSRVRFFPLLLLCLVAPITSYAQSNGGNAATVHGMVVDPSGAAIPGAAVTIQNPVSHFIQTTKTDDSGAFTFLNIPYNNYHLSASAAGFQSTAHDIDVRS